MGVYKSAMKVSDLEEGSIAAIDLDGRRILLSKIGGEVYAVSGICSHEETDLGNGFVLEDRIVCPLHLSQFELKTGEAVNPPATEPLQRFNTKVDGDTILVEV